MRGRHALPWRKSRAAAWLAEWWLLAWLVTVLALTVATREGQCPWMSPAAGVWAVLGTGAAVTGGGALADGIRARRRRGARR